MALTTIDDRGLKTPIDLLDNEKIRFGTGNDLAVYHDGSDSHIHQDGTGDLQIRSDNSIEFNTNGTENAIWCDTNGAVKLYYDTSLKLLTTSDGVKISGHLDLEDDLHIRLGTGDDYHLWHSSDVNYLSTAGTFKVTNSGAGETLAAFVPDGAVELYHNNTKAAETTAFGLNVNNPDATSAKIELTSSSGYLGYLYGEGSENTFGLLTEGNEWIIKGTTDGAVELFYNHVKKLETTSDGVNVSGQCHIINSGGNAKLTLRRSNTASNTDDYGTIRFQSSAEDNNVVIGAARQSAENDGYLFISTSSSGTTSERFRITSAGQVLIGTSTPSTWTSRQLVVGDTSTNSSFIEIRCSDSSTGHVLFSDSAAGDANNYTGYLAYNHSSNHMSFHTDGGNERVVIDDTGDLKINDGDLVIGTAGHGIDFSATSGTGTSEIFDDYEEGTWTPTVTTASGTVTVGNVYHAEYTKIGRMVYITARFTISAVSSPSGWLKIYTLPFTADSFAGLSLTTTGMGDTDDKIPQGLVEYNTTYCMMRTFRDGIESDNISGFFQNGTAVIMSSCYNVA